MEGHAARMLAAETEGRASADVPKVKVLPISEPQPSTTYCKHTIFTFFHKNIQACQLGPSVWNYGYFFFILFTGANDSPKN